jgi:hypothetical protein
MVLDRFSITNAWDVKILNGRGGRNVSRVYKDHDKIALKLREFHANIMAKHDEMLLSV